MATTTNYAWETPDDTDLVKDGAAAIRTLGSSIDTTTKALNPSTTLGDIEYRSSTANTNTRLGIGSTGQVLTVSGGVPAWATPSSPTFTGCAVYNAGGNVTYTSGVISILNFTSEDFDTNTFHDNSTNTSRITIPSGYAGKYLINQVWRVGVGVGYVITRLYKNGASVNLGLEGTEMVRVMNQGSNSFGLNASVVLNLAVGDYIEMAVQTDYAGTSATYARFSASYLGA